MKVAAHCGFSEEADALPSQFYSGGVFSNFSDYQKFQTKKIHSSKLEIGVSEIRTIDEDKSNSFTYSRL